jgi:hypothetical protein
VERPPHNDEPQDESGQIIRFPTRWVPLDGIQPLDEGLLGPDRSTGVAICEPDPADDRPPESEAGDFWDGGDTQEFVAAAGGPSAEFSVSRQEVASVAARGRGRGPEVRRRVRAGHRRTALISAAALALVTVVVGALAFEDHGLAGRHPLASSSAALETAHRPLTTTGQSRTKRTTDRSVSRSETHARRGRTATPGHKAPSRGGRHSAPMTLAAREPTQSSSLPTRSEATPTTTYSDYRSSGATNAESSTQTVRSSSSGSAASGSSHPEQHAPAWGASGALGPMSSPDG